MGITLAKLFLFTCYIKAQNMSIINSIKNICKSLGNNNKSIYPVIAIATANGIFRPTFTMLKKGENPESKKYAALREGITEVIAVPTYWASGVLAAQFGEQIMAKAMDNYFEKQKKQGRILSEDVKQEMKSSAIKKGKAGLMLIGVCVAAGIIIPALCSACVTPIMNKIAPQKDKPSLDIKENVVSNVTVSVPVVQQNSTFVKRPIFRNTMNSGMKVGGV